jgi:hypothetical protein
MSLRPDNDFFELFACTIGENGLANALAAMPAEYREVVAVKADGLAGAGVRLTASLGAILAVPSPIVAAEAQQLAHGISGTSMLTEFLLWLADTARYGEKA